MQTEKSPDTLNCAVAENLATFCCAITVVSLQVSLVYQVQPLLGFERCCFALTHRDV